MGQVATTIGEGVGWCADCRKEARPAADFTPPGMEGSSHGICPDCGSSAVLLQQPPTTNVNAVVGQQEVRMGDFVLDHLPLPACKWDLYKTPAESSWFLYRQRVPLGALRLLIGDFQFPESDQEDKGLDILHSMAYALPGGDALKKDIFRHTADLEEFNLSPEDYVSVKIPAGTKTVSGMELPEGKMTDVYPNGAVMVSINKGELLLGLWPEQHQDFITASDWFTQPDSGASRGLFDTIPVAKRHAAGDGQIFQQLAGTATPAWLYDPNIVKPAHMGYIGKPGQNIPVNLSMIPNLDISKAIKALEPGSVAGQYVDYIGHTLTNHFQVTAGVLDFSDYLPIDNRTATGAQIASALANSLVGPQLASKAGCHKRVIEMLIEQYPKRFPFERSFSLHGKRGKRPFMAIAGADMAHTVVCEVVQDSELPVSPFIKQQDFTNWMTSIGGPQGYSYMKKEEPDLLQQSMGIYHVKMSVESFDAVEMRCRMRLDQMIKTLKMGIDDPRILVASVKPPISVFESQHAQKMLWWSELLDDDEMIEPEMMPVRYAVEILIQTHFSFENWQPTNMAAMQAEVMAASQPEDPNAAQGEWESRRDAQGKQQSEERQLAHQSAESDKDRQNKLEIAKQKRPSPKPKKE